MGDIAKLGLQLDADGAILKARQFKTEMKAAASEAGDAFQNFQRQSLTATTQASGGTQGLIEAQRRWLSQLPPLTAAQREQTAATRLSSDAIAESVTRYDAMVAAENRVTDSTRQMTLTQMKAIEMNAALSATNNTATASFDLAGAGMGRVRQGLTSLVAQATGTIPVLDRLGGSLLMGFGLGLAPMIAILGGIAAVAGAWRLMHEDSDKAREAQDKLTKSLGEWYDKQRQGATGDFLAQINAETNALKDMRVALNNTLTGKTFSDIPEFLKDITKAFLLGSLNPADEIKKFEEYWNKYTQGQKAAIAKGSAEVAAAARQAFLDLQSAATRSEGTQAGGLASMISSGNATSQQTADAVTLMGALQDKLVGLKQAYAGLTDAKLKAFNLDEENKTAAAIKTIHDALADQNLDLELQVAKLSALHVARNEDVVSLKLLNIELDANADKVRFAVGHTPEQIAAYNALRTSIASLQEQAATPDALAESLQRIRDQLKGTTVEQSKWVLEIKATYDAQLALAALLNNAHIKAAVVPKDDSVEAIKALETLRATLSDELTRGIEAFTSKGLTSFTSFFQEVEHLSLRMAQQIEKALSDSSKRFTQSQIDDMQRYKSIAQGINVAAGVAGGAIQAFDIGKSAGSTTSAGLGGAASGASTGAAIGTAIAPGIGTAVGAVSGAIDGFVIGLFGQASKIKEARQQFESVEQKYIDSLKTYPSQFAQSFAGIGTAFQNLADAAKAAHTTVSAEAIAAKKEAEDATKRGFLDSLTTQLNALNGPGGEYVNQLNAIQKAYQDQIATAKALGLGQETLTQIEAIREGQEQQLIDAINAANAAMELQKISDTNMADFNAGIAKMDQEFKAAEASRQLQLTIAQYQLSVQHDILSTNQAQLSAQKQAVDGLSRTVQQLQAARDGLKLNTGLTTLSPIEQLQEARSQFASLTAKAMGGDQDAAGNLSQAAQTLLQASHAYNASGAGYVKDYNDVQAALGAVQDQFGAQLSTEDKVLKELQKQTDIAQQQTDILTRTAGASQTSAALNIAQQIANSPITPNSTINDKANQIHALFPGLNIGMNAQGNGLSFNNADYRNPVDYYSQQLGNASSLEQLMQYGGTSAMPGFAANQAEIIANLKRKWNGNELHSDGSGGMYWLDPANGHTAPWENGSAAAPPAGFWRGGDTRGGIIDVGERGPERLLTGAARVMTAEQVNAPLIARINRLIDEVAALRRERSDDAKTANRTVRQTSKATRMVVTP